MYIIFSPFLKETMWSGRAHTLNLSFIGEIIVISFFSMSAFRYTLGNKPGFTPVIYSVKVDYTNIVDINLAFFSLGADIGL